VTESGDRSAAEVDAIAPRSVRRLPRYSAYQADEDANDAWLSLAKLAHNLTRAAGGGGRHARRGGRPDQYPGSCYVTSAVRQPRSSAKSCAS
jgi:hypothetical protein